MPPIVMKATLIEKESHHSSASSISFSTLTPRSLSLKMSAVRLSSGDSVRLSMNDVTRLSRIMDSLDLSLLMETGIRLPQSIFPFRAA